MMVQGNLTWVDFTDVALGASRWASTSIRVSTPYQSGSALVTCSTSYSGSITG